MSLFRVRVAAAAGGLIVAAIGFLVSTRVLDSGDHAPGRRGGGDPDRRGDAAESPLGVGPDEGRDDARYEVFLEWGLREDALVEERSRKTRDGRVDPCPTDPAALTAWGRPPG